MAQLYDAIVYVSSFYLNQKNQTNTGHHVQFETGSVILCIPPGMIVFYDALADFLYTDKPGQYVTVNMKMPQILPARKIFLSPGVAG